MFPTDASSMDRGRAPWQHWRGTFCIRKTSLLLVALSITCWAHDARAADRVVLEPVQNPELAIILANSFTLPLLLDLKELAEADLYKYIAAQTRQLTATLYSLGYLDARIDVKGEATEEAPLRLQPVPGQLYRIAQVKVAGLPSAVPEQEMLAPGYFSDSNVGKTATREALRSITSGVLYELREASYGKATIASPEITTHPETAMADVVLNVHAGPALMFGKVQFSGSFRMDGVQAQTLIPFQAGAPYSATAVDALQAALEKTNLFLQVRIELAEQPDSTGHIDVNVRLRDNVRDTVALSASGNFGLPGLVLMILMIGLLECVRVTPYWSHRRLRRTLSITVVLMMVGSGAVILERLNSFLN